ncbi:MAG TPA: hypothetical protein VGH04_08620 [Gemmatimonadaceae bacterium]
MSRFVPWILMLTTLAAMPSRRSPARARPDFSGSWAFDLAKSEGQMLPTSATLKVTQTDKQLTVERTTTQSGITRSAKSTYNLDGSPSKNSVEANGSSVDFNSTTEWTENVLVIKTTANIGPGFSGTERWSLSDDKKTLVIAADASIGPQNMTAKQAFTKQ